MKLLLHPLPIRILHWVMVTSVVVLLFTGFYIHRPPDWLLLPLGEVRKIHGIFGLLLTVNFILHIYYYIYTGKFTEPLLLPRDWQNMRAFLRYYLFITEHHPNFGRYNPGQKFLFSVWALAVGTASVTGLTLLLPDYSEGLQRYIGGLPGLRIIQYCVAVIFASTVPLHLYLVFTEEPAKTQSMFTGYVQREPKPQPMSRRVRE